VWCGVVWCGVVGCGVVGWGVVWCGVVWCGVVWCVATYLGGNLGDLPSYILPRCGGSHHHHCFPAEAAVLSEVVGM
jgi:hypothetical protein